MQFLNPIWFFALAALSIPVIIHLWNVRPGKTRKVGSISLITEASKSSSHSLKLLDILLLILRCLLLALLAMLLASPVWQKVALTQKVKGWLLVPKENFKEIYQKFKPVVDSLNKAGYEFHYFNRGFAKNDLKKLLTDTTIKDTAAKANYWSIIRALDSKVSSAMPLYVFTPNGMNYYKGSKPQVNLNLRWQTYTAADSVSKWIASASLTNSGSIKVTVGNSNPAGTSYSNQILQNDGSGDMSVSTQNGQPSVSLKGANSIAVDTSATRIAIYTDKYAVDAGYLKAALFAAVNFSGRKAVVKQYSSSLQIPGEQTWLFWLSEKPVSSSAKNSNHIFKYEAGKVIDVHTWIEPGQIALAKSINPKKNEEAIWKDGFGKPVLGLAGNTYHFYSHFNPLWNELVWSDAFPKMILKLIEKDVVQPAQYDKRVLSNTQIQPNKVTENKTISSAKSTERIALSHYFWLLLIAMFIAERILAHKTKTISNG
ncbi:BatA domain-containing protein [Mucilaginibacter sp. RB4R14]|uniref:BatA domain-containing protein n=1 Tax=Mucilaginibacter aurantiaciroseus TaxID=2949308 RepID=UPI0020908E9D|nr:BatA domain-containing protein [Mucilaginibacter aurantiaciroseus]MCO5935774.1 BatA domain-containing protein [Mucilaginibacter aurantiaciroseus]